MASDTPFIDVKSYDCYRSYLRDTIEFRRQQNRRFTVRGLCLKVGLKTDNYVMRIVRRQRNMSPQLAEKFVAALGLKDGDASYFMYLVNIDSARTDQERALNLRAAAQLRVEANGGVRPIIDDGMLRHWYLGAIWELAGCEGADLAPREIVRSLGHKISVAQAATALQFLRERRYLVESDGKLTQSDRPIFSSTGKADPVVQLNHKQLLMAARDAVDLPMPERVFSGLTIAIKRERLAEIRARIRQFVLDLRTDLAMDEGADTVYRVGMHSFPLARFGGLPRGSTDELL